MHLAKLKFSATIFIPIVFPLAVFSATIRDDVPDSDYVALGNDSAFDAVGVFSDGLTGCGILIAPDWVLTAAHLIAGSSGTFTLNGVTYSSANLIRDPSWDGNPSDGSDFALVHLNSSLTPIPPPFFTGATVFGQTATFVGYGLTGNGLTGYKTLDGQKRGFQDVVDVTNPNFGNTNLVFGATFLTPANGASPLEGCVAPGDSGGGVFVGDGSQYFLAGIISFVDSTNGAPKSVYGNISGFDALSPALPWIESVVPEPSPNEFVFVGGIIFFVAQKFRRETI